MDKYSLPVCNTVFFDKAELNESHEAILPEYCPGLVRIISTDASVFTEKAEISDGRVHTSGKLTASVCYESESGGIKSVRFPYEFSHFFDVSGFDFSSAGELVTECSAFVTNAHAKPKNQRSMEIKTTVYLSCMIYGCETYELYSSEKSPETELHTVQCSTVSRHMLSVTPKNINAETMLDEARPSISEIVSFNAVPYIDKTQCSDGNIDINGTVKFKCIYKAESEEGTVLPEYAVFATTIPFEESIPCENVLSSSMITGKLIPINTDVSTSFDPYGENRVISLDMTYEASFDVLNKKQTEYADDGFCADFECDFEYISALFDVDAVKIQEKSVISHSVPADSVTLVQITDCDITFGFTGTDFSDGKLHTSGKCFAKISGYNDKGEPVCIQNSFNAHVPLATVSDNRADRKYLLNTSVKNCDAVLRDGEISLNAEIYIDGFEISRQKADVIKNADVHYDNPKPVCRSEHIIYYPESAETPWNIAKKYEVPLSDILQANGLKNDASSVGRTVIIPCT